MRGEKTMHTLLMVWTEIGAQAGSVMPGKLTVTVPRCDVALGEGKVLSESQYQMP